MIRLMSLLVSLTVLAAQPTTAMGCPCADIGRTPSPAFQTVADTTAETHTQVALEVGGITCASCPQIVHQALSSVAGVRNVELRATDDDATLIAVVSCDKGVRTEQLADVTNGLGYPTLVVDAGK